MSERPSGKPRGNRWQPVPTGFMIQQSIKPFRDFHRTYVLRGLALSFLEPPVLRQPNGRVKIHLLRAIWQAVNIGAIWISLRILEWNSSVCSAALPGRHCRAQAPAGSARRGDADIVCGIFIRSRACRQGASFLRLSCSAFGPRAGGACVTGRLPGFSGPCPTRRA